MPSWSPASKAGGGPRRDESVDPVAAGSRPSAQPPAPWPGALHAPRPTTVERLAVDVLAADGTSEEPPLGWRPHTGDDQIPHPADRGRHRLLGLLAHRIRWWDPERAVYRTRLQVVTDTGRALLLSKEHGQWYLTGRYC